MKIMPARSLGHEPELFPEPPLHVRRLMLALGTTFDGYIEQRPEHQHPVLLHSMLVPAANLILIGTRCRRPLVCREIERIAHTVGHDGIIVRATDDPKHATFDIVLRNVPRPLLGYRLWMRQPLGSAWLVPTAGEPTFVRLDGFGLEPSREAPFADEIDARRGLKAGAEYLSIAAQGWF